MDQIQTVSVELLVPTEAKDVVDLLDAILEKLKSGASLMDYTDLVDDLGRAVAGIDQLPKELASQYRDDLAGYMTQRLMHRLMPV